MNFGLLVFQQTDQVIVLLDRLQRLDEHRLPAGRCSVRHTLYATALFYLYRNYKALAADGD